MSNTLMNLAVEAVMAWNRPNGINYDDFRPYIDALRAELVRQKPNPVAWLYRGKIYEVDPSDWAEEPVAPLYPHPHRREWVGLTDEDMVDLQDRCGVTILREDFAAIEAKLKEKNT